MADNTKTSALPADDLPRRQGVKFIVLLGIVSLFGDMTYEGARGFIGPYLAVLGASATAVGFIAGFGELIGYALRLVSGYLSDRTGRYWAITIFGYVFNLFAVPLLALAGSWQVAAVLIIAERMGRAIRTPARDAMLSHAAARTGMGWGFGLHEALDQTGAVLGPLIVSAVLLFGASYQASFGILLVPAILSMSVLLWARAQYPRPHELELATPPVRTEGMRRVYWIYLAGVVFVAAGYADFALIAYHFGKAQTVAVAWIPALYALAMATDAVAALLLGRAFDRFGLVVVMFAAAASVLAVPLAFLGGPLAAVAAMALWGIGMGGQESVMRAAIATLSPPERRGTAYGVFNAAYGVAWFAGSVLLGILYDQSIAAMVAVAVVLQLIALPILWSIRGASPRDTKSR